MPKVHNGSHKLTIAIVLITSFDTSSRRSKEQDESHKFSFAIFMTTDSCTTTSLMTTRNVTANLKKKQQRTLVDRWEVSLSSAPEWTRQAWMEPCFVINGLYFSFMLDGCLYFSISAYAALKWTSGAIDATRVTVAFVTMSQIATWPITSYGEARDKSPAPHAPINRFGKKNLFHFNIEIEKPSHWFNFWTSVILSVWPNDDNYYTFSIFT